MSVEAATGRGTGPGSMTVTCHPRRDSSRAAVSPNTPAPTMTIVRTPVMPLLAAEIAASRLDRGRAPGDADIEPAPFARAGRLDREDVLLAQLGHQIRGRHRRLAEAAGEDQPPAGPLREIA